jgi:hypothetical protein
VVPQGKLEEWLVHRSNMHYLIQEHLLQAQDRMKKQADKHRFEREFAMGSMVYMKLQPYVQSSVLPRSYHKLSFKYFGPLQGVGSSGFSSLSSSAPSYFCYTPRGACVPTESSYWLHQGGLHFSAIRFYAISHSCLGTGFPYSVPWWFPSVSSQGQMVCHVR